MIQERFKKLFIPLLFGALSACGGADEDEGSSSSSSTSSSSSSSSSSGITVDPCLDCTGLLINEAVSSNSIFEDEDGDSEDWIELFNNSSSPVSLAGWSITDDPLEPSKWLFPNQQIEGHSYLLLWASDKDRAVAGAPLHTNFKISSKGETLYLYDQNAVLKHQLEVSGLRTGTSVGLANANQGTVYYDSPTPGEMNSAVEFLGVIESTPEFSDLGGVNSATLLMIEGNEVGQEIRYTLDGSVPSAASFVYQGALPLNENTVVRARILASGYIPSITYSRTFLPNASHDIAVVTLETDPVNFFDTDFGIYVLGDSYEFNAPNYGANFWEDWERDIHFSFYEPDGSLGVEYDAGVKIFGGYTRSFAQKALSFHARARYGADKFEYPFIQELPYEEFESFVLRASGNDWMNTMLRDRTFTSLMEGTGVDYQAARPVAVYLNGEYWGLHNLREKVNEHFLDSKHDIKKSELNLLEAESVVNEGSNESYLALETALYSLDPLSPEFYAVAEAEIDLQNFIAYHILQIYIANTDWPQRNIKYWSTPDVKWRWILYDTDFGFGLYSTGVNHNSLQYATGTMVEGGGGRWNNNNSNNPPEWATVLLRTLLENPSIQQQFVTMFADFLNSRFKPEFVEARIQTMAASIATEIPKQRERWSRGNWNWEEQIQELIDFGYQRPTYVWDHLADYFGLSPALTLSLSALDASVGSVQVNSLNVDVVDWSGRYFPEVPVTVTATPAEGFSFSHWSGDIDSTEATIVLTLTEDTLLTPVFVANP